MSPTADLSADVAPLSNELTGPSPGAGGAARAVSVVDRRSSGIVTMPSGLMVSTGAAAVAGAVFSLVVEDASPEDDATRFPEQPQARITTLRHIKPTNVLDGIE